MKSRADTDVLVVGAGPTGLMLANQLARRGVRAMIIDRHAGPVVETRALGVQARTLEIYTHLGIDRQAIDLGRKAEGANMWVHGRRAAWVPLSEIGRAMSPYPYLLILGQDDNEKLLGETLRRSGMAVQWNTELVELAPDPDRVIARVKDADGTIREVAAAWVAGCDGARSAVRELNRVAFPGAPYEHVFFVADTHMAGPMVPDQLNVYLWRGGFHLFFPMRGEDHWRLVGIVPPPLRGKEDLKFDDVFDSIRREAGAGLALRGCTWFSTYRIHHRRAERFRVGRCFVLGDAAHIHSPVGAQGMNTGLQDAYNLGWKLALVVSGRCDASLLDTYEAERIPVARHLLETTDRLFSAAVSGSWVAGTFRTSIFPKLLAMAMRIDRVRKTAFRTISQIGIRYRESPLSETRESLPESAPRAGDRFPWLRLRLLPGGPVRDFFGELDDTRFHLVLAGQPEPTSGVADLEDLLRIHRIPGDPDNDEELSRTGIPRTAFYLVRPDGYVGLCGAVFDPATLSRWVSERLRWKRKPV
jgi:2-polyprenyl-6-methoxyphenol hydroxylase-like FAD-dependent oxidoreductase